MNQFYYNYHLLLLGDYYYEKKYRPATHPTAQVRSSEFPGNLFLRHVTSAGTRLQEAEVISQDGGTGSEIWVSTPNFGRIHSPAASCTSKQIKFLQREYQRSKYWCYEAAVFARFDGILPEKWTGPLPGSGCRNLNSCHVDTIRALFLTKVIKRKRDLSSIGLNGP